MEPQLAHDAFFHVRVIIGLVAGLSITRLLTGLARFVQHPARPQIYQVHRTMKPAAAPGPSISIFSWWATSRCSSSPARRVPDRMDEYAGFAEYFHARQRWFYGLLAAIFLADIVDSALKGGAHWQALGPAYIAVDVVLAVLALVAMGVRDLRFHAAFVVLALAAQFWRILRQLALFT